MRITGLQRCCGVPTGPCSLSFGVAQQPAVIVTSFVCCGWGAHRHFSVGGKDGFRLYQCHPFRQRYGVSVGGISVCEMLGSSSLLAVVGGGEHVRCCVVALRLASLRSA